MKKTYASDWKCDYCGREAKAERENFLPLGWSEIYMSNERRLIFTADICTFCSADLPDAGLFQKLFKRFVAKEK